MPHIARIKFLPVTNTTLRMWTDYWNQKQHTLVTWVASRFICWKESPVAI